MKWYYRVLFCLDYYIHNVLDMIGEPMPRSKENFNKLEETTDADR